MKYGIVRLDMSFHLRPFLDTVILSSFRKTRTVDYFRKKT